MPPGVIAFLTLCIDSPYQGGGLFWVAVSNAHTHTLIFPNFCARMFVAVYHEELMKQKQSHMEHRDAAAEVCRVHALIGIFPL